MKGEHRLSLNAKLLMVQLISLCLALAIFFVGIMGGSWFVEERYLSPEACYRRQLEYIRDLDSYVQANGLSSSDAEALETWARAQKYVYLALYKGEKPILETDGYETDLPEATDYANNLQAAENSAGTGELVPDEDGYYRLQFADGVFRVSVVDFSEMPYYDLVVILSLALACLALLLVNILHNRNITRSIIRLSKEVQWVAQGSRDDEIRSDRDDEIGDLARAVEQMRRLEEKPLPEGMDYREILAHYYPGTELICP